MVHSDEFKPAHISSSIAVRYEAVSESAALLHHEVTDTGASRYFNWVGEMGGHQATAMMPFLLL
jgi:hypothetical protein